MGIKLLEAFITSSVLIVAVLILRRLCRGKINLCLQYGIWLIVAVKLLLVPVPFWESPFSIMNLIKTDVQGTLSGQNIGQMPGTDTNTESVYIRNDSTGAPADAVKKGEERVTHYFTSEEQTERQVDYGTGGKAESKNIRGGSADTGGFFGGLLDALPFLLYLNAFLLLVWMLYHNIKFYRRLRSRRILYEAKENGKEGKMPRIYLVEGLKTPCLYGRSIYLPVDAPKDEKKLRHILAHETAHYRHKDYIWSAVRLLCSAFNWYNPLVWIAAAAQKQDCELACDESAIRTLGEEERIPYAETLIRLVGEKMPRDVLTISTTMTADAKEIKTRISLLVKKPVTAVYAAVITGIVLAVAVFCTFTGKAQAAGKPGQPVLADEGAGGENTGQDVSAMRIGQNAVIDTERFEKFEPVKGDDTLNDGAKDGIKDGHGAGHEFTPSQEKTTEGFTEGKAAKEYTDGELSEDYFGITYSEPSEKREYYDLYGTKGLRLSGTYLADISEAEGVEEISVYKGRMGDGDGGYVIVEKWWNPTGGPKEILWIEEAHTDSGGWNNIYVGEKDGKAFLLTLKIDIGDGYGTLAYHAFRLDAEGKPIPYNGAKFMYEAETYKEENFEQWYRSLSVYLEHSRLLLSTQDGVLRSETDMTAGSSFDGNTIENNIPNTGTPDASHTFIPAPEEGGYEFMELKELIEEGI